MSTPLFKWTVGSSFPDTFDSVTRGRGGHPGSGLPRRRHRRRQRGRRVRRLVRIPDDRTSRAGGLARSTTLRPMVQAAKAVRGALRRYRPRDPAGTWGWRTGPCHRHRCPGRQASVAARSDRTPGRGAAARRGPRPQLRLPATARTSTRSSLCVSGRSEPKSLRAQQRRAVVLRRVGQQLRVAVVPRDRLLVGRRVARWTVRDRPLADRRR